MMNPFPITICHHPPQCQKCAAALLWSPTPKPERKLSQIPHKAPKPNVAARTLEYINVGFFAYKEKGGP